MVTLSISKDAKPRKHYRHAQYVGLAVAEQLCKMLPNPENSNFWRRLPDGTDVGIGTECLYPSHPRSDYPPVEIDLGGDIPFIVFPDN